MDIRKLNSILMRTAAVLLLLVMLTTSVVSGHYARYTTTVTSGDSARVAKYEVTVAAASADTLKLDPNGTDKTASYNFSVTSGSEVTVEYDLVVVFPKAMQEGITLTLTQGSTEISLTQDGNIYKAANAGTFSPTGGTHAYTLTFAATEPIGADELKDIAIRVDARQVD